MKKTGKIRLASIFISGIFVVFLAFLGFYEVSATEKTLAESNQKGTSSTENRMGIRDNSVFLYDDAYSLFEAQADEIRKFADVVYLSPTDINSQVTKDAIKNISELGFHAVLVTDHKSVMQIAKQYEVQSSASEEVDEEALKEETIKKAVDNLFENPDMGGLALYASKNMGEEEMAEFAIISKAVQEKRKEFHIITDALFGDSPEVLSISGSEEEKRVLEIRAFLEKTAPDQVLVVSSGESSESILSYRNMLEKSKKAIAGTGITWSAIVYPPIDNQRDSAELMSRITAVKGNADAVCLFYAYAVEDEDIIIMNTMLSENAREDLSFDNRFLKITRPSKDKYTFNSTYYIMGVSDPNKKLTVSINGKKASDVTGRGKNGSFGFFAELSDGENEYYFSQSSGVGETITITKEKEDIGTITVPMITSMNSAKPSLDLIYENYSSYKVECTAPSGSTVFARIGTLGVQLTEVARQEKEGMASVFRGDLSVYDEMGEKEVKKLGKVTYHMTYEGEEQKLESAGDIYIKGKKAKVFVRANRHMAEVYENAADVNNYLYAAEYPENTVEEFIDYKDNLMYLGSGGYVRAEAFDFIEGSYGNIDEFIGNIKKVKFDVENKQESIVINGLQNAPYRIIRDEDGEKITIRIFGVTDAGKLEDLALIPLISEIFSEFTFTEKDDYVEIELVFRRGVELDGFNISSHIVYEGESQLMIYFKKPVKIMASEENPLAGITVLLDAGHGGEDPGAFGPMQEEGPVESDVALATAKRVEQELEAMGATVYMIRDADYFVDLYVRASINDKIKPDYFLSIHLNSVLETSNAGDMSGTEIYMHNAESENLANSVIEKFQTEVGRKDRGVKKGAYVIARPNSAPSLLCEIGFISNPEEFEEMTQEEVMAATAKAVVDAILENATK